MNATNYYTNLNFLQTKLITQTEEWRTAANSEERAAIAHKIVCTKRSIMLFEMMHKNS